MPRNPTRGSVKAAERQERYKNYLAEQAFARSNPTELIGFYESQPVPEDLFDVENPDFGTATFMAGSRAQRVEKLKLDVEARSNQGLLTAPTGEDFDAQSKGLSQTDPEYWRDIRTAQKGEFVRSFEEAILKGGNVSSDFLLQFSKEQLTYLAEDIIFQVDEKGYTLSAKTLAESVEFQQTSLVEQAEEDRLTQQIFDKDVAARDQVGPIDVLRQQVWGFLAGPLGKESQVLSQEADKLERHGTDEEILESARNVASGRNAKNWTEEVDTQAASYDRLHVLMRMPDLIQRIEDHVPISEGGQGFSDVDEDVDGMRFRDFYALVIEERKFLLTLEDPVEDIASLTLAELDVVNAQRKQQLVAHVNSAITDPERYLTPGQTIGAWNEPSGVDIMDIVEKSLTVAAVIFPLTRSWAIKKLYRGSDIEAVLQPIAVAAEQAEQDMLLSQEVIEKEEGLPDAKIMVQAVNQNAQIAWDDPLFAAQKQEYLSIWINPITAFAMFRADVASQVDPEDQTRYIEQVRETDEYQIEQMRDSDFSPGAVILNGLGAYNRLGPMRLATWTTLLFDDMDFINTAMQGELLQMFRDLENVAEQNDYRPSVALEIDGSLMGLLLDLGGGIFFDPTTWLFAPSAMAKLGMVSTGKAAAAAAKSAPMRAMVQDVAMASLSPSKGIKSVMNTLDWVGSIARRKISTIVHFEPQTILKQPWKKNWRGRAVEVRRELIEELLGPEEMARVRAALDPEDLTKLVDDVAKNGYEEVLEISLSRTDETIWLSDGAKRVLAAADGDISHLPATLRVTDDVAGGSGLALRGYAKETLKYLDELPSKLAKLPAATSNPRVTESVIKQGQNLERRNIQSYVVDTVEVTNNATKKVETLEIITQESQRGLSGSTTGSYFVRTADGEIVGGVIAESSRSEFAIHANFRGQKLLEAVFDAAHTQGDDLIRGLKLGHVSRDGRKFLLGYRKNILDQTAKEGNRAGKLIDDVLGENGQLGIKLKSKNAIDEFIRPDKALPFNKLWGDVDLEAIRKVIEEALKNGQVFNAGQYTAIAMHSGGAIRKLMRGNAPGEWITRYAGQFSNTPYRGLTSPTVVDDWIKELYRLFGDSSDINVHLEKLYAWETKHAENSLNALKQTAALQPRANALGALSDEIGGLVDDVNKTLFNRGKWKGKTKVEIDRLKELRVKALEEDKYLRTEYARIHKESGSVGATRELREIILESVEDFKRIHIDPKWGPNTTWDDLKLGPRRGGEGGVDDAASGITEDMASTAKELGVDGEELMDTLSFTQNSLMSMELPISPLDMIAASEYSGMAYRKFMHSTLPATIREKALTFQRLWNIDKVFTLSTAATVSFDELLRIFHRFGMRSVYRYAADKSIAGQARIQALIHRQGLAKHKGSEYLVQYKRDRLRVLGEYTQELKSLESNAYERFGHSWVDVLPGDPNYIKNVQSYIGGLTSDTGFRAFMKGKDAYRKWYMGPDGETLRLGTVIRKGENGLETTMITNADEHFKGWTTLWEDIILAEARKSGKFDEVHAAVKEAARLSESGIAHDVDDVVVKYIGSIRGTKTELPNKMFVAQLQEKFFEKLFMDPVNYRRAFLADLVRSQEKQRLLSLAHSQGKRVVSDVELEGLLELQGFAGATRTQLRGAVHEMALEQGLMPQSYIDDLVEVAVKREIEHTLYKFQSGSRLGQQGRLVAPFGKPWGDMAAFWGRETVKKPVLRGMWNEKNMFYLRTLNEKGYLQFPLPNKAGALISRMANTDFEIDKGVFGGKGGLIPEQTGGLIPGTESTDFSPLFFLPTKGENPFSYLVPGLGPLPIWAIDMAIKWKYDPITQPEEYQRLVDDVSQLNPSIAYQQGGAISRVLGGGLASRSVLVGADIVGLFGKDTFFNVTSQMGDITREIDRSRGVSVLLADPIELELLLQAETAEEAEKLLMALIVQADRNASLSHLGETALRMVVPLRGELGNDIHEIEDVWFNATQLGPLAHLAPDNLQYMTDDDRRQLANDIRGDFFNLPAWQRDTLVVSQPAIAVNLVGSWEWTPNAINKQLPGTDGSYRSGSTRKEKAFHQTMVDRGFIRVLQPIERARRILGTIDAAKTRTAQMLYKAQVQFGNDGLFADIKANEPEVWKLLGDVVRSEFGKNLDLRTEEEVWYNWNRIEKDLEVFVAEEQGINPVRGKSTKKEDITRFDRLRTETINIHPDFKPWGADFPGINEENVSQRFQSYVLNQFDPRSALLSEALGIELEPGMTGAELFEQVQQIIVQSHNFIYDLVRAPYETYIKSRSDTAGISMLLEAAQSDLVTPEFQQRIADLLFRHDLMKKRAADFPKTGITQSDKLAMSQEFYEIMIGAKAQHTDWEGIWNEQFERTYGPIQWTVPEPASPWREDGGLSSFATTPFIEYVVDGDTIMVQKFKGSAKVHPVRLLGIMAEEVNGPNVDLALEQEFALKDALVQAANDGVTIYLVRDERFGQTDQYGRVLAWLWLGDEPYWDRESMNPKFATSGGDRFPNLKEELRDVSE